MYVYQDTNSEVAFKHAYLPRTDFDPSVDLPVLYVDIFRGSVKIVENLGPVQGVGWSGSSSTQSGNIVTSTPGVYTIVLDYNDTQFAGQLRLNWHNADRTFDRDQLVDVVTPICDLSDLEAVLTDESTVTKTSLAELENTIRQLIEAYTGTTFGVRYGTKVVRGVDDLSRLLDSSVRIDLIEPPLNVELRSKFTYLNIKQAPPEDLMDNYFDGVIRVPRDYYTNVTYTVTGSWGYAQVPAKVQEAALILAKEFSCNESLYRDRYLQVVQYGDNRFQFNPQAFAGTGNVKADQLLDEFKKEGMILV